MIHLKHKYEYAGQKVFIKSTILFGDSQYKIYKIKQCSICKKIIYELSYVKFTLNKNESDEVEVILKKNNVQSNFEYAISK